jgi:hypothetical protein
MLVVWVLVYTFAVVDYTLVVVDYILVVVACTPWVCTLVASDLVPLVVYMQVVSVVCSLVA